MSKLVKATITCPHCGKSYSASLFRTLWGEDEHTRNEVLNDKINICTCPHCNYSFKAPFPFMYVDVKQGFAVWWEPVHDADIDEDAKGYAKLFGPKSYYATAPRIADWNEFKEVIQKYYRGELHGGKIERVNIAALKESMTASTAIETLATISQIAAKKNKGCLGILLLLIMTGLGVIML